MLEDDLNEIKGVNKEWNRLWYGATVPPGRQARSVKKREIVLHSIISARRERN
jgi:hypothetical protein